MLPIIGELKIPQHSPLSMSAFSLSAFTLGTLSRLRHLERTATMISVNRRSTVNHERRRNPLKPTTNEWRKYPNGRKT